MQNRVTLDEVGVLSGEDMVLKYGPGVVQQLVDLVVAAVRKGEDDEARAIDGRLREVERALDRRVLQDLLSDGISIRAIPMILESVTESPRSPRTSSG